MFGIAFGKPKWNAFNSLNGLNTASTTSNPFSRDSNLNPATVLSGLGSAVVGMVGSLIDQIRTPASAGATITKGVPAEVAKQALPYLALSEAAYERSGAPDGWERLNVDTIDGVALHDAVSGLDAEVFRNTQTGEVNIAFRGSELLIPFVNDWVEDGRQIANEHSPQYRQAIQLANAAVTEYGNNISFTGHSLGAGLASTAGLAVGAKTYAFDNPGLGTGTLAALGSGVTQNQHFITNINLEGELASDMDGHQDADSYVQTRQIGDIYYASADGFNTIPVLLDNPIGRHSTVALRESLEASLGIADTTNDTLDVLGWFGNYIGNSFLARR